MSGDHTNPISEDHYDKLLLEPFYYTQKKKGSCFRDNFMLGVNVWLKIPTEKLRLISSAIDMLHNASLIIDDIQDNAVMRRGAAVAHNIFGIPFTINAGNMVYFVALEKLSQLNHPGCVRVFCEQMLTLHRGQGMELYWRDSFHCPTEAEYTDVVIKKTSGLFTMAIRLMQLFSSSEHDLRDLSERLGLYYQIRNDYDNFCVSESDGTFCTDFTEGNFSYPIIHAIQAFPDDHVICSILRQRSSSAIIKKTALEHLIKLGALEHTKKVMEEQERQLLTKIQHLGGNHILENLILRMRDTTKIKL